MQEIGDENLFDRFILLGSVSDSVSVDVHSVLKTSGVCFLALILYIF